MAKKPLPAVAKAAKNLPAFMTKGKTVGKEVVTPVKKGKGKPVSKGKGKMLPYGKFGA